MAELRYTAITSLDGYVDDASGGFGWAAPDAEVHRFVNDAERAVGTHLYGRRMYAVMAAWETMDDPEPLMQDYARIWRAADKVVFSTTLDAVTTARTRLQRTFDPAAVRQLVAAADRDVSIGGPGLAAHALAAGLVAEVCQFVVPEIVGGGTRWLPDDARLSLELVDEQRFGCGVVCLRYRVLPV